MDAQLKEVIIDPIRSIAFVAGERHGPCHRSPREIDQRFIRSAQEGIQHRRFMNLARREMEVQRFSFAVTQEVDFCGESPARAT